MKRLTLGGSERGAVHQRESWQREKRVACRRKSWQREKGHVRRREVGEDKWGQQEESMTSTQKSFTIIVFFLPP